MYNNILFDFDGVLIDSMLIRSEGFRDIFDEYDKVDVDALLEYHNINGGLSRYHKIRYFFENILKQSISESDIQKFSNSFSEIMRERLVDNRLIINDSICFIKNNYQRMFFHIVSGSDERELRYLCDKLKISHYFRSIHGSPTYKDILVKDLLKTFGYNLSETIMIGDSVNDYTASKVNGVDFFGYNNPLLQDCSKFYINSFDTLEKALV